MKKIILLACVGIITSIKLFAQTTSPSPYCYAGFDFLGGNPVGSDWINSVSLGTLNNASDTVSPTPHYTFYNNLAAPDLVKGTSYTMNLNFYIGGGAGYAAWIDFNQDDVFDSTELIAGIVTTTGIGFGSSVPVTATVAIPATALTGNTRMRVRISEDDNYHSSHPGAYELACDSNTTAYGGETEDYTVNILPALGVKELNNSARFSLYPNPVSNLLSIECNVGEPVTYVITNVTGAKEVTGVISKAKDNIDVSALSSGLHFIEVADHGQLIGCGKFIKQQ